MKQDDYWEKFMESGRIEDYLGFRASSAVTEEGSKCVTDRTEEKQIGVDEPQK